MTTSELPVEVPAKGAAAEASSPVHVFGTFAPETVTERRVESGSLLVALALHAWVAIYAMASLMDISDFASSVRASVDARLKATIEIDEQEVPEPEPPPEPEPEPEPEVTPEPTDAPLPDETVNPEPAPPAAAEAGQVLTAEPDPNEPLDLTGEGFISGTGTRFAGGVTAGDGTSDKAVRNRNATGKGVVGAKGTNPEAKHVGVDKSRPAGLPVGANWRSCGFPPEADAEQINQAYVRVVVVVSASGKPTSVNVLSDPGYGFARIAQRCAMRFTYPTGLDKLGNPIATATPPFMIHFTR